MNFLKICKYCNNEFYTKDKNQKHCNKSCYNKTLFGKGNPFYGKKHPEGFIKEALKRAKFSERFNGENNPFYGKKHTKETINIIKQKNKDYRENNKELIEIRKLKRLDLSIDKLNEIYLTYKTTPINLKLLGNKFNVDNRVIKKYIIKYEICTQDELKSISFKKQFRNAHSAGEEQLYEFLCGSFGKDNIKRQFKLESYYFDFIIDDKILIEYDGFYWHEIRKLVYNNDKLKNMTAANYGFFLYRVKENEKRKVDFLDEIQIIREIRDEIQVERNY